MAQESNQTQVLCSNGCGFYGNPRNNGMCSVCYKDSLQRQNNSSRSSDPGQSDVSQKDPFPILLLSSSLSSKGESMTVQSTSQHEQNRYNIFLFTHPFIISHNSCLIHFNCKGCSLFVQLLFQKGKKSFCFYMAGFDCRCGHLFCSIHRYSDVHNCSFDYKADAAEKIRKENPLVVGEKIKKI
uniref:AN1-type zinc finger protein 6 n=1 Tax=Sinocyclocheilus grahami TaxID=75366 RepID=A0A672SFS6_SINGR